MIRPHPAEWFEILAAKEDAVLLLEALARAGCVQLEAESGEKRELAPGLPRLLGRFDVLAERFSDYWPAPEEKARSMEIGKMAGEALLALEAWCSEAAPLVESLRALQAERARLELWRQALEEMQGSATDLSRIGTPGRALDRALFVFPVGTALAAPPTVFGLPMTIGAQAALLAIGPREVLAGFSQQVAGAQGTRLEVPDWLAVGAGESLERAVQRLAAIDRSLAAARARLDDLSKERRLGETLGRLAHAKWTMQSIGSLEGGENLWRVTGWTDDRGRLDAAIDASGARAVAHFPQVPPGLSPPLLLLNPWWARPFEAFSRAFGMPARHAADPSVLLALIVPLLFGYMFGDVGQGAVLVAVGLAFRKRMPLLGMLVPGGMSAMLFGLVFGSVFGLHGIVPALWLEPLDDPLPVLVVPLAGGAVLLALGLLINALESYWRGKFRHWLATDAGQIAVYAGLIAALFDSSGFLLAALGALARVLGQLAVTRRLRSALAAVGALLEHTLQLLINTLSFVRVGAFALAHAGLSTAIVALAEGTGSALSHGVVLVLGNIAAIVIEATVVSVQTTRLVLFEFFTRFFVSKGREFRPLPPPVFLPGGLRETKA
jgi:V/A-type H+-transporting ATPase subunit I